MVRVRVILVLGFNGLGLLGSREVVKALDAFSSTLLLVKFLNISSINCSHADSDYVTLHTA